MVEAEPEPESDPVVESLLTGLEDLLSSYCPVGMANPADSVVPSDDPPRATGPEVGSDPGRVENAPDAVEIERLQFASGGCGDQSKVIVVASLAGSPATVQLSPVIDLPGVEGHVADPAAPGGIGQRSGWNEFISYDGTGIFQSDHNFARLPTTAEALVHDNVVVFVLDRPADVSVFTVTVQSFFRPEDTAESPTIWNTLTRECVR